MTQIDGLPTAAEYLNKILERSLENHGAYRYDADLAKALGVTRGTISGYRHGQSMSVLVAVKVAELLGIHPMETVAATMASQAKNSDDRIFWRHYYEEFKTRTGPDQTD